MRQTTEEPIKQAVENHLQPTSEQCNGHSALEPDIKTPLLDVLAHETNTSADGERDALIN